MADLRIAKVMKVHPEANSVDIVYVDSLARVPLVQVMGDISSNTGTANLEEPTAPKGVGDISPTDDRDIYAIVGTVAGHPIVMGFLAPQVCQLLFKGRPNFRVTRHASDVYSTLDDAGNLTVAWPNGTHLKVGEDPAVEDLQGLDFDQKWAIKRNLEREVHVKLVLMTAGVQKAMLHLEPSGKATVELADDLSITTPANIETSAAQWNHTGPIDINGTLHTSGNIDSDATVTAATDVVGGGKHLKTHTHGGVTAGAATTAAPT